MKLIIFALIPLILSIGITPAFSLQPEDVETECREGQVLVYRISNLDYICTSQSTASLWANLGMAEIVQTEKITNIIKKAGFVWQDLDFKEILKNTKKPAARYSLPTNQSQ